MCLLEQERLLGVEMAHFAELDANNIVINVVVVNNSDVLDENGQESEQVGIQFLKNLFGEASRWIQTSFNGNIRKNYANVGMKYHSEYDAFLWKKPFPSWTYDPNVGNWNPPVPEPEQTPEVVHNWNEEQQVWELINL